MLLRALSYFDPSSTGFFRQTTVAAQDEARELNEDIFETIYFAACEASCELAQLQGPYQTYAGDGRMEMGSPNI